jgi:RNA polymerase sigma factor for flagellar operon FliA
MTEARNVKPGLSPEEISALWIAFKQGGDLKAKEKLLLHYTGIVKWTVRRMMPRMNNYNEYEDFVNSGIIGLISAMERFDLDHGTKFETYAVSRIRGEIIDYMRSQDWAPPSLRKKINSVNRTFEELEARFSRPPTDQMVADELGMPVAQVQKIQNKTHMFNVMNFEEALSASRSPGEIGALDEATPESILMEKEKKAILIGLIDALPEKERLVITLYYYEGLLLKEIAAIMGVTESRVSQIHSRILEKMRVKFER